MRSKTVLTIITATVLILGVGCAPKGSTGGRIDPYRTTESDRAPYGANIPDLLTLTDETAQALAAQISSLPEIKNAQSRQVLALGTIENKTHTPTQDFELMMKRLRSHLHKSPLVKENFIFVEDVRRMDEEFRRTGATGEGTARYDAKITWVLQGDFIEARRGARQQFYYNFKLVNLATREIIFDKAMDGAYLK